ncbi:MAG: aminotransferase class III-fold pyridoxal phosphate-dependent enzyme [Bacteroidales bacterium]
MLGLDRNRTHYRESNYSEVLLKRRTILGRNLSLGYRDHIRMARGWMQYMYDTNGVKYLDAYNNVPHLGHSHHEVVDAACSQMKLLSTNTRYLYDSLNQYAELLLSTFPGELDTCFFVSSGTEANELALRIAFEATGERDVIVLEGAYHGNTNTMIDISPYKHDGPGGHGSPEWVHRAPVADCYRGMYKYGDREAGLKYGKKVGEIVASLKHRGRGLAAFIAETCPSVGGQVIFPDGYLKEVYRSVREAGGICIADEVQTAYGRMAMAFLCLYRPGSRYSGPGKPIGNGYLIGAVITTSSIAESIVRGWNSSAHLKQCQPQSWKEGTGDAHSDQVQEHAKVMGTYLLKMLGKLKDKHMIIGDVRGSGLFIGVELEIKALTPAHLDEAAYICNRTRENRILIGVDGPFHNVLKIRPPMPFSRDDAGILYDRLNIILGEIEREA